ncbi:uncharacterized protein LOC131235062 [Magnolia sinica]|uniref:uncharacterized protein LOC131235062 n=1 Tax=Magnolia sinica TaxID=86752 RepID=UPI00265894B1|nr:uncharacterized protein LOC131235062 [Magnolia sinica]
MMALTYLLLNMRVYTDFRAGQVGHNLLPTLDKQGAYTPISVQARVSLEYVKGMKEFIEFAFNNAASEGKILCPCVKCANLFWRAHKEVVDHLVCEGIMPNYTRWVFHGEASSSSTSGPATSTHDDMPPRDDMHGLLHDVFGISGVDDMPTELPS